LAAAPCAAVGAVWTPSVKHIGLPWLHIAGVVGEEAERRGFRRIGILGTRYTMAGPVYTDALGRLGIDAVVPAAADFATVDRIIFAELVDGVFSDELRRAYNRVIARLGERGCDAVTLACTEIPLLVRADESPLPTLDSTRLLARAALTHALG